MRELGFEHLKEKLIYMKTRTELDRIKAREQQVLRLKQSLADEVLDHKIDVRFLTITYQRAGMTIDVIINLNSAVGRRESPFKPIKPRLCFGFSVSPNG